jgi:glucokinase
LPWEVDGHILGAKLINDVEAMAWGVPWLIKGDTLVIQEGVARPGNRVVVAPGTGLGEAGLFWDGEHHLPWGSEGGQTDWAPRNEQEFEIFRFCQARFGHVATERVVSGPGYQLLLEFFGGSAEQAQQQFLSALGAEVGNAALKAMAVNGVYLGGGAVAHFGEALKSPAFLQSLHFKGRFSPLMEQIPVHLITQPLTNLMGAARYSLWHSLK